MTIELEQGSWEWKLARCGKATGSRIADAVDRLKKGGWSARARDYLDELVSERLTGIPCDHFVSHDMQWGIDREDEACDYYTFLLDEPLDRIGFVPHPHIPMSGASPDRLLINAPGLVQVKCPKTHNHMKLWHRGEINPDYIIQCQWEMACRPEREFCDFISFDPRVSDDFKLWRKRLYRDEKMITELEREVSAFLDIVNGEVEAFRAKHNLDESELVAA